VLEVGGQRLCVAASSENAEFAGCWKLAHEVDEEKAQAKYENGYYDLNFHLEGI
jgi:HSP20 family molecular chaperone IbpA